MIIFTHCIWMFPIKRLIFGFDYIQNTSSNQYEKLLPIIHYSTSLMFFLVWVSINYIESLEGCSSRFHVSCWGKDIMCSYVWSETTSSNMIYEKKLKVKFLGSSRCDFTSCKLCLGISTSYPYQTWSEWKFRFANHPILRKFDVVSSRFIKYICILKSIKVSTEWIALCYSLVIMKMKQGACRYVYCPKIEKDVDKSCRNCAKTKLKSYKSYTSSGIIGRKVWRGSKF